YRPPATWITETEDYRVDNILGRVKIVHNPVSVERLAAEQLPYYKYDRILRSQTAGFASALFVA
ncbi:MAG: hypothetical protein Q7S76_00165, partial [bacterium]|nr:hypothetical protein [bacterium]